MFVLKSKFVATKDQAQAAEKLGAWVAQGQKNSVLLGVTGSGKTYTMATVIAKTQYPTLVISHNKTLAGQLYQEMRDFFPQTPVSYFVSYYDYYQPEAYIVHMDKYIEKEVQINDLIDKLRLKATSSILTNKKVIVVASVSCIYNIGSPVEYGRYVVEARVGGRLDRKEFIRQLVHLHYERSEFDFKRGTFRVRGDTVDIYPAYEDYGVRVVAPDDRVKEISFFHTVTGKKLDDKATDKIIIYPAKHFMVGGETFNNAEATITADLKLEHNAMVKRKQLIEAERLWRRVNYDLEMIRELGYVNGIENYSRYFDGRKPGEPPFTLLDYFTQAFGDKWLVIADESHMTVPQIRGMYHGDLARKKVLVEHGFRLKSAYDNRPLRFEEFYKRVPRLIYVSATPGPWEMEKANQQVAQQLVRPTGIVDPPIIIRAAHDQVVDLVARVEDKVKQKQRVLVTTLTKKIAEELSDYLKKKNLSVAYLHSDIKTLKRLSILEDLRNKKIDVLVGVNLLREGLDLPEVGLVAILDADSAGFLRSKTALIQLMGRAARNTSGVVVIYADEMTEALKTAMAEVDRRRRYQIAYNQKHGIVPRTIDKRIKERIVSEDDSDDAEGVEYNLDNVLTELDRLGDDSATPLDRKKLINKLEAEMRRQARGLHFEVAIAIREKITAMKAL